MFCSAQQNQPHPTVQPVNGSGNSKRQKALSILQLASEVTISLFIAGVVVPSFLRSASATKHALAVGSLHTLTIARVTFSFTLQNLGFAISGGLFGSLMALAIASPATFAKRATNLLMFWRVDGNASSPADPVAQPTSASGD